MKVRVTDENGATSVIGNDLEPAEALSEEVRGFLDRTKHSREGSVTLDSLGPGFLVDLYVGTSVRRVEALSSGNEPRGDRTGIRWNQVRTRYSPPMGTATVNDGGAATVGGVGRGDDPTPDTSTQSPHPSGDE